MAASLVFYAWGEPSYLVIMLVSIVVGYFAGLLLEAKQGTPWARTILGLAITICFGLLAYFKYADFFLANLGAVTGLELKPLGLALPIGISFYQFQIVSYLVDVYRQELPAERSILRFAQYVSFFPQLIAGPIVRYADVASQIRNRSESLDLLAQGLSRFCFGLAKKVLLANQLGDLCRIFGQSQDRSVLFYWLYAIAFSLQIYFDFSGYSDMAIGLGKIFGFELTENFDYPYMAKSVTEFWRRWHMSLGSWFRDYVYIPMGGNRVSQGRWLVNILCVWLLTGFWHGAAWNFVAWGLFYAVFLLLEKWLGLARTKKLPGLRQIYLWLVTCLGFVLFDAGSLNQAIDYYRSLFGLSGLPLTSGEFNYYLKSYAPLLIISLVAATPLAKSVGQRINNQAGPCLQGIYKLVEIALPLGLLVLSTAYLVDGSFNPFLYFRF